MRNDVCEQCDEFIDRCVCGAPAALTEADVRRIVAEMITAQAFSRIEKLRSALKCILIESECTHLSEAIEIAGGALYADDKLARGES